MAAIGKVIAGMKRSGNLWQGLLTWTNLYTAAGKAATGKRSRPDVAAYLLDLEPEIVRLRHGLMTGEYRPGAYRTFQIFEPKARTISAAPFRDRVVHHALTQIIEPIFERRFTSRSFASRTGYGTHRAVTLAKEACRQHPYALQCDIRKYFPSIDHEILSQKLRRVVKCDPTLGLAEQIIAASNPQDEVIEYFPGDTLFTPYERRRGLPLGNQTSQFFANVYLNGLDHFVLRELRPAEYARYVDDFVLFGESKGELREMRAAIVEHLDGLRLTLNPGKSRIHRTADGITFLGWRITPEGTWMKRESVVRMRRRFRYMHQLWVAGEISWEEIQQRVNSWIGHAKWGDTWKLREQMFAQFPFPTRGEE